MKIIGYTVAVLTLAVAFLAPFLWFGVFNTLLANTGLRIDPIYTGGEPLRGIQHDGYVTQFYRPVPRRTIMATTAPFVQIVWKPVAALPQRITESIDLDGDSQPDFTVTFDKTELRGKVDALNNTVKSNPNVTRQSLDTLLARVGDTIVLRIPVN